MGTAGRDLVNVNDAIDSGRFGDLLGSRNNTLAILAPIALATRPLTVLDLTRLTGLHRASLYRNLDGLESEGWIVREESPRRYAPALKLAQLGLGVLRGNPLRDALLLHGIGLCYDLRDVVYVTFYEAGLLLCTDSILWVDGRAVVAAEASRVPAACTPAGKILLAFQPESEIEEVARRGLPAFTPSTHVTYSEIIADIRLARERGYGVAYEEWRPGSPGFAVPVLDRAGHAAGALNCRMAYDGPAPEQLEAALKHAARASVHLGYRSGAGLV